MADEPRWGPSTTYRSSPQLRRGASLAGRPPAGRAPSGRAASQRGTAVPPSRTAGAARPPSSGRTPTGSTPVARPPMSRRRRRGLVRLVVLVVLLGVVAYPLLLGATGYRAIHRAGPLPASALPDTPGRTVLLVGSDSRADLTRDQKVQLSTGTDVEGTRTDTILLLHSPAGGGPTVLLSIPRDSYVAIPGHGRNKINAAYSRGGMSLLTKTVEQATGVRVDGYAETGLGGFAGLVDAVGGVTMCPAKAMKDPKAGLDIPAGCQTMGGATALGYARSRDLDALGDLGRAQRQRELIAAIAAKAATPATLLNPFTAFPLARAGGGALTVDDGFGPGDLLGFARAMQAVAGGGAVSLNVPVARTDRRTAAGLVVDWDAKAAKTVFDDLNADDTQALRAIAAAQPKGSSG